MSNSNKTSPALDLFHVVNKLIPDDQEILSVAVDTPVRDAIARMEEHSYSQLPVVAGRTVVGVFSYRSLIKGLMGMRVKGSDPLDRAFSTPVESFLETMPQYARLDDAEVFTTLVKTLEGHEVIVVSGPDDLVALLTPFDLLRYLLHTARAYTIIEEIERSLRWLIASAMKDEAALDRWVRNAVSQASPGGRLPTRLDEMTFDNYIALLRDGRNWPDLQAVFGRPREAAVRTLEDARDARNQVFHFRIGGARDVVADLDDCRKWLYGRVKAVAALMPREDSRDEDQKPVSPVGSPRLLPFQQRVVDSFLASREPGAVHLLVAPVGSGKTQAIVAAVKGVAAAGAGSRVLVIVAESAVPKWLTRLAMAGCQARVVDARLARAVGGSQVPARVYLLGMGLARRELATPFLLNGHWDLVVVDEASSLSEQTFKVLQQVLLGISPPAVLLSAGNGATLHPWTVTRTFDWSKDFSEYVRDLQAFDETRKVLPYRRAREELQVAADTLEFTRSLDPEPALRIRAAASSSLWALETELNRLVAEGCGSETVDWLLERLPQGSDDGRIRRICEILDGVQATRSRLVIFCWHPSTLDFVATGLESRGYVPLSLGEDLSPEMRQQTISTLENSAGVLVALDQATEGLSLAFVDAVIHFDLPMLPAAPDAYAERLGRYNRLSRRSSCTSYIFEDEEAAYPFELLVRHSTALMTSLRHRGRHGGRPHPLHRWRRPPCLRPKGARSFERRYQTFEKVDNAGLEAARAEFDLDAVLE
ncbi:MAG: CBS domain-containing protein [Candidatus Sericytochromatia bacterium]|nr:CBS domain-containing protein [Candidatus Tanganyikabacteria bacterium]